MKLLEFQKQIPIHIIDSRTSYIFLKTQNISIINSLLIFTFIHSFLNHVDQLPQQAKLMLMLFKLGQKGGFLFSSNLFAGTKGVLLVQVEIPKCVVDDPVVGLVRPEHKHENEDNEVTLKGQVN